MSDRVTFDFITGEVTFDTEGQQGTQIVPDLADRRAAIMAAAGFETISGEDLKAEIKQMFGELGFDIGV